jgi:hypothetical protein
MTVAISTIKDYIVTIISNVLGGVSGVSTDIGETLGYVLIIGMLLGLLFMSLGGVGKIKSWVAGFTKQ